MTGVIVLLLLLVTPTYAKQPKPWPVSQCTNGWVDRMTGMCPYRKTKIEMPKAVTIRD